MSSKKPRNELKSYSGSVFSLEFDILIEQTYQEHDGALSFGTDAWTSPNHKAYVAITVHFEQNGVPICLLLDVVQVACAHTGVNLAKAFAAVLEDYGIADKVSKTLC
jgi:hypothetical protein